MTIFESSRLVIGLARLFSATIVFVALLAPIQARAVVDGVIVSGPVDLTAREGYVSMPDGGSIYSWGYSTGGAMQLPGPTLIVTAGQVVTVTLHNALPAAAGNVSIVFPGHTVTSTTGGVPGNLVQEAPVGGSVTYSFTADQPGTYQYYSGTRTDFQVDMGLYGALIVRPADPGCGYDLAESCFDREYLFLLSTMDLQLHQAAEQQAAGQGPIITSPGEYRPEYFMINGRAAPDTMSEKYSPLLPNQPYNALARMHPGEKMLLRIVGSGRIIHPFHTHGNHVRVIANDGRLLLSATDPSKLAGPSIFTIPAIPGGTTDAIFEWTGKDLGWDIYGHTPGDGSSCIPGSDGFDIHGSQEWCEDHLRPIPVDIPALSSLSFGGFYSGSPYLGAMGSLPPGEGGLNPNAGFSYMWHSHTEREMINNDIFPGGMMTMLIIEAPGVAITE